MRLSTKSEYACLAIIDLGEQSGKGYTKIDDISKRKDIPKKFLEQILLTLKNRGYLRSKRGPYGGYALAKKPKDISLADVVRLMDGPLAPVNSVSKNYYNETPILKNKSLADFMERISNEVVKRMERATFDLFIEKTEKTTKPVM